MAGSITDSDIYEGDLDIGRIAQAPTDDDQCNLTWKQPWEKTEIKVCHPNGEAVAQTDFSRYVPPLKVQFLKNYQSERLEQIIQEIPTIEIQSFSIKDQLFEITLKTKSPANECMEIVTALMKLCDDVIIRPIQRLKFTSKLAESVFRKTVAQRKLAMVRDEITIFIVGFQNMKDCVESGVAEINRLTVTKTISFEQKWKMIALTKFGIMANLSQKEDDVSFVLQDQPDKIYIQGSKEDVTKAVNELQQMLARIAVEYLAFDPLILKLLLCKKASEYFNENFKKNKIEVEWIVDDGRLCVFGNNSFDADDIRSVMHTNFVSVGFDDASTDGKPFSKSQIFTKISRQHLNKLMICESTRSSVIVATTKTLVQNLLYQEKVYKAETIKTAAVQVNTMEKALDQLANEKLRICDLFDELEMKPDKMKREAMGGNTPGKMLSPPQQKTAKKHKEKRKLKLKAKQIKDPQAITDQDNQETPQDNTVNLKSRSSLIMDLNQQVFMDNPDLVNTQGYMKNPPGFMVTTQDDLEKPHVHYMDNSQVVYMYNPQVVYMDNPQGYTDNPQDYMDNPQCYTENPQDYMDNPQGHTDNTQDYMDNPQDYMDNPQDYMDNPQDYTDNPQDYTDNPQDYTDNPQDYMDNPQDYTDNPQDYTDNLYTDNPQDYMDNPQDYTDNPQDYTDNLQVYIDSPQDYSDYIDIPQWYDDNPQGYIDDQ